MDSAVATNDTLTQWDNAHHLHPFTDHQSLRAEGSRFIDRGEGCWVWDSNGVQLLDGMAGLWNVNLGYAQQEIIDAITAQLARLPFYNSFFKSTVAPAVELAHRIAEIAPPGMDQVMFASSGSEAIDSMVRLVRHYWALEGRPEKQVVIGRRYGYHGSTIAGVSLGGMKPMHDQLTVPLPGIRHAMPTYHYGLAHPGESEEAFGLRAAADIERIILEEGPERVAAFVGEPVMGAGGVKIPPMTYWPEVQRICRKYDVLLVTDEVISGYGRLGHWFGCQYFGIEPDIMTTAKALTGGYLPLSALIIGQRVTGTLVAKGGEWYHGFTNAGHPAACAAALANLRILERDGIIERVRTVLAPALAEIMASVSDHPIVGEARSVGLMAAIELVGDKQSKARIKDSALTCREFSYGEGLIMRAVEETMILAPPLVLSSEEMALIGQKLRASLDKTAKHYGLM